MTRLGETLMLRNMASGTPPAVPDQEESGSSGNRQATPRGNRNRRGTSRKQERNWAMTGMKAAVFLVALMVAFLFKDIIYEMYLKISNQEKAAEQDVETIEDNGPKTQIQDKPQDTGPADDDAALSDSEKDLINAALKTADAAIAEHRYADARRAIANLNAKDNAILAERLVAKEQQIITDDRQRWQDRAQDALNRAVRRNDTDGIEAVAANAHGDEKILAAITAARQSISNNQAAATAQITNRANQLVREWRFDTLHEHIASQAGALPELQELDAAIRQVEESIAAMRVAIATNKIKYQGTLKGLTRPELAECSIERLYITSEEGVRLGVGWQEISSKDMQRILLQTQR